LGFGLVLDLSVVWFGDGGGETPERDGGAIEH